MGAEAGQRSLLSRYLQGPALLEQAVADLGDGDLDAPPSQGGWTLRQIAHHVVDGDDLWKTCIKAALGNEAGEFTLEWYWVLPQEHLGRSMGLRPPTARRFLGFVRSNQSSDRDSSWSKYLTGGADR